LTRGKQSGERFVAKVYDLKVGSGQVEILDEEIKKVKFPVFINILTQLLANDLE